MCIQYLFVLLLLGCFEETNRLKQSKIINEISALAPKPINFKNIHNEKWSRVCFFGPYTQKSSDVLGFNWDVTKKTAIESSDAINVIVFVTENRVDEFIVLPRGKADFWKLSRQCFLRRNANFKYDSVLRSYVHSI
jgi:hypothetical protein